MGPIGQGKGARVRGLTAQSMLQIAALAVTMAGTGCGGGAP